MPRPQRHAQSEKTTPEHATFFSAPQCEPHADRMPIALMALPGNAWPGQGDPGRVRTARSRTYSYAACAAVLGAPKRRKVAKPAHREPRPEGAQEVISRGLHGDMWAGRGHQGRLRTAISRRYAYAKGARAYRALLKAVVENVDARAAAARVAEVRAAARAAAMGAEATAAEVTAGVRAAVVTVEATVEATEAAVRVGVMVEVEMEAETEACPPPHPRSSGQRGLPATDRMSKHQNRRREQRRGAPRHMSARTDPTPKRVPHRDHSHCGG